MPVQHPVVTNDHGGRPDARPRLRMTEQSVIGGIGSGPRVEPVSDQRRTEIAANLAAVRARP